MVVPENKIDDYKVVCDESNNSEESINRGELNVEFSIPLDSINLHTAIVMYEEGNMSFAQLSYVAEKHGYVASLHVGLTKKDETDENS